MSRLRRTSAVLTAMAALCGAVLVGTSSPAQAAPSTPADNAREKAHQLHQQLVKLQDETEQAAEDYNSAQSQLGQIVAAHLLAQRQLEDARMNVSSEDLEQAATVRSLYRTGGAGGVYGPGFRGPRPRGVLLRR